jgi:Flp pilus assembly protein TadD
MDPRDDPFEHYLEEQRDQELRKRYQDLNLEAEIAVLKVRDEPVGDATQKRISVRLVKAQGLLGLAFERGAGFSDALDAANEVLQLESRNSEALTIRAIAYAQRKDFREAVQDAEAAIALDANDGSPLGVWMRRELPVWRKAVLTQRGKQF